MSRYTHPADEACPLGSGCTGDRDWCAVHAVAEGSMDVNDFLQDPLRDSSVRRVAGSLLNHYGLASSFFDDVLQEVWLAALTSVEHLDLMPRYPGWLGYVKLRGQTAVRVMTESSSWTGSSGTTGLRRRLRSIGIFRAKMLTKGIELDGQQLVDAYNAQLLARTPGARAQGMLAKLEDITNDKSVVSLEILPADSMDLEAVGESACPLVPFEARELVELGIEQCDRLGYGDVARAMYSHGDASTLEEVCAEIGEPPRAAKLLMAKVDEVFREILEERFGITRDDVAQA